MATIEANTELQKLIDKAATLTEAFPYLVRFRNAIIVIKYGGSVFEQARKDKLLRDVVLLKYLGLRPVIVHGGGSMISQMLKRLDIETTFIEGLRVTDAATMAIIEMVLSGTVNSHIVSQINQYGGTAAGISGVDLGLLEVKKLEHPRHDYGFVGSIVKVNADYLLKLIDDGIIPVISPVSPDREGRSYNVNADEVAQAIAAALRAEKLVYITDVDGLLDANGELIASIDVDQIEELLDNKVISGGMIPKITYALRALENGVQWVHVLNGNTPGVLLLELFTNSGVGTMISYAPET